MGDGAQIRLQVQICAFGSEGMERLRGMRHPQIEGVSWLVSWQLPDGDLEIPPEFASRADFRVVKSAGRGLSCNRNTALDAGGDEECVLLGDDDVDYSEQGLRELLDAFAKRPECDVICVRYRCCGEYVKPYGAGEFSLSTPPYGWYVTSFELAFRRSAACGIRFNEYLGIGAPRLVAGEETVFLYDMLHRGARGVGLPIDIGAHNQPTTGERMSTDARFLLSHGAVMMHIKPLTWLPRLLLHAKRTPMPFFKCLRHTLAGVRYAYREGIYRKSAGGDS